ncbi:PREDICTED: coiled-coil domain-containing protein 30-like [Poecilia mexicana]|uniref:coiled-coil domain-containing protein 30-like n=1 Tax=Poecilia mexicana TaxID=48701 RepID=UPI00072E1795|nr:PREDICTED: coiled-coil domain-containing protein 30-like [Poecilia mexicana]
MARAEELEQIVTWLTEEGLAPEASKEAQLAFLWRTFLHTRSCLDSVTKDLETKRSQHFAEMAEVRKSLEQIKIFTEQKDVLAQEIQDENEQLRKQLLHLVSLQDSQINEVAKMLYQQGLTELVHSSPSEQVAYLLVERASLLETNQDPGDGDPESRLRTNAEPLNPDICAPAHKRSPRPLQSSWKKLFGLHKTLQSKHTFVPGGDTPLAGEPRCLEKECSRLERDVEEGSRRLAMAHNEIRHLKDELESAHFTQKTYEPELQAAQEEVKQLRKEVGKLKEYEMVELRKAKELNDRLDVEIRALRNRVRSLDAEKKSLEKTMACQQEDAERLESALKGQQMLLTIGVQVDQDRGEDKMPGADLTTGDKSHVILQEHSTAQTQQAMEKKEGGVESLQEVVKQLELAVRNLQGSYTFPTDQASDLMNFMTTDETPVDETCQDEQEVLGFQTSCPVEKQPGDECLQVLQNYQSNINDFLTVRDKCSQLEQSSRTEEFPSQDSSTLEECSECPEGRQALMFDDDERETYKEQICKALNCIDEERSKYHNMKERLLEKLSRAKQKLDEETMWRDKKINNLERELSLCYHSLKKEKEVVECIRVENERLLSERRKLLQQLSEEDDNMKNIKLTACVSQNRVQYLETENKNLGNKVLQMSNQISTLERKLQNMQFMHFTEELQKMSTLPQKLSPVSVQTARMMLSEIQDLSEAPPECDAKRSDLIFSPDIAASVALNRTTELGYLNLTSLQSLSDKSSPDSGLVASENTAP